MLAEDELDVDEAYARYVVDSWFVDNGQPAVVMPLENWRAGEAPEFGENYE